MRPRNYPRACAEFDLLWAGFNEAGAMRPRNSSALLQ